MRLADESISCIGGRRLEDDDNSDRKIKEEDDED